MAEPHDEPAGPSTAIPSGTVAIVRDRDGGGLEVLMVRRAPDERDIFSGMWVFPGGMVDPEDHAEGQEEWETARVAAAREAFEEAGIELAVDDLHPLDRWEPEARPGANRRFAAWVFIAPATDAAVKVDGTEIHEHRWLSPSEALAQHAAETLGLVPPTWLTLRLLEPHIDVASAMTWARARASEEHRSGITEVNGEVLVYWDADELRSGVAGARHRLTLTPGAWRYERSN